MNWYYVSAAGQQAGPVDDAGLDALLASGKLNPDTLIWRDGMPNWQSFREVRPASVAALLGTTTTPSTSAIDPDKVVCAECGGIFPAGDTIKIGSANICANCKPIFVQKMQEGLNVENPGAYHYAGFWIRVAAMLLDMFILMAIMIACVLVMSMVVAALRGAFAAFAFLPMIVFLLEMVLIIGYEMFFIGKYGATPGKMACKIRVIVPDGSKMSYGRSIGRYFAKIISGMIFYVGFIIVGFDEEKRGLHDRICNTRVVYR